MKRNSLSKFCAFLFTVLLVSCSVTQEQQTIVTERYEKSEMSCLKEGLSDSINLHVVVDYPTEIEGVGEEALHNIQSTLIKHSLGEDYLRYATVDEMLAAFAEDVLNEYRRDNLPLYEEMSEYEEYGMNLNNEHFLEVDVQTDEGRVLSFSVERYLYLGGAHGINNRLFLNFDKQTGCVLTENDLFIEGAEEDLTHLLLLNLVRQNDDLSLISDVEASDYEKESIRPNGNFYFAPEGVVYIFNPYEIGPYSLGETNICIPVEEVRPYLKAEWNLYAHEQ
ncbi:MAG: DUF3298 domain-containing protein [Paludibacteraceae bacterium]|nr:DUF3298 domain-containing protein [Paludibacteraceae bacterium]MBO7234930.1 DUF3298 domain-containing protein [Paludibacteraceae bacterium]MBO7258511.1 DUF3298 domain-containing protein [Paludibacteraceae bacterium]